MIYIGTQESQLSVEKYADKALQLCNVDVKPFERRAKKEYEHLRCYTTKHINRANGQKTL